MGLPALIHIRDARASLPAAAAENEGCLLVASDEGNPLQYSDGAALVDLSSLLTVRTTDPASPVNNTAWAHYDAGTGAVQLRLRLGGTTYAIDLGTI